MLKDLQKKFLDAIQNPERINEISEHIVAKKKFTAAEKISVYRGSVIECKAVSLATTYPVCFKLLGEEFFKRLAYDFIPRLKSTMPNLNDYGFEFIAFLKGHQALAEFPYIADLCRLEWAWHLAYIGESHQALDVTALGNIPADKHPDLVFDLAKNASLLHSEYPVEKLWRLHQGGVLQNDFEIKMGEYFYLIWRPEFEVKIECLDAVNWNFLSMIQMRLCFGEVCERLAFKFADVDVSGVFVGNVVRLCSC